MSSWLCEIDSTFNYPETVILLLSKEDEKFLERELAGELDCIYNFFTIGCDYEIPSNAIISAKNITNEVEILRANIVPGCVCARCKSLLLPSFVDGYAYTCPHHDEDLYSFETTVGEVRLSNLSKFLFDFFDNANLNPLFFEELAERRIVRKHWTNELVDVICIDGKEYTLEGWNGEIFENCCHLTGLDEPVDNITYNIKPIQVKIGDKHINADYVLLGGRF